MTDNKMTDEEFTELNIQLEETDNRMKALQEKYENQTGKRWVRPGYVALVVRREGATLNFLFKDGIPIPVVEVTGGA